MTEREPYSPRFPHLTALLAVTVFVAVLGFPFFTGQFLVGPHSDQYVAGYGFRQFWTEYVRLHGSVPLWNPYIFGGLPYVGAMHGDLLYPFTWIRLVVPTDVAMTLAFLVHLVLAGFFTYLFLRALRLPWAAALSGGVAYQLTGIVASLVHPGHDGKLYVSTMLPLALWALVRGIRDGKVQGFGVLALATGLAILSPSFQMAYYLLLAAGMFTLYLAFFDPERPARPTAWLRVVAAFGAVLLGAAVAGVQLLPFLDYLPYSPRSVPGSSTGWEYATSYSMPPEELLNTILPDFSGLASTYWGRNHLKYHGEYLGVGVLILASIGLTRTTRPRLRWTLAVIAAFFLLVSLGGHTPFYRLVYQLLPMMKKVRAPGMAFYLVAFPVAVWAALGVEAVMEARAKPVKVVGWAVTLGGLLLLSVAGVFTNIGRSIAAPGQLSLLLTNQAALNLGALRTAVFGAAMLALLVAWSRGRVSTRALALGLPLLVGLDLWSVDRRYFVFSPPARELFAPDPITERLGRAQDPFRVVEPFRVLNVSVYPGATLMGYDVADVLGYHGNEIRFYDDLLGGKNVWRHLPSPQLWKLLAVRYIIYPDSSSIPGFHRVAGPVRASSGQVGYLLEADTIPPYARVAPAAVKAEEDRIVPTLLDPRLDFDRLVLLDPSQPVNPPGVTEMPEPSPSLAKVTAWEPGKMTIAIAPASPTPSWLVVAENWYPTWQATVDGTPTRVLRGNQSLITIQLPAGANQVELGFTSPAFRRGRLVTVTALLIVAGLLIGPAAAGWRRRD